MKISRKNYSFGKPLMVAALVIIILAVVFCTYFYGFRKSIFGWSPIAKPPTSTIDYSKPTDDQKKAGTTIKSGSADTPAAPTPIPGSDKKNVQVSITSANPNSPNGPLQIRTQISAVDDTGVCTLTLTSPGKTTVTKTAQTQSLASISTCKGFDIPLSELSAGTWNAQIQYSSSTLSGSTTQDIVIK